ncbi:MAG: DUF2769 domain-containing protein [Nitrospirota bacterium]
MPKVENSPANEKICRNFCGTCPSYPGTGEFLFCSRGRSNSPKQETGCNCGVCDVWNNYGLNDFYYCIKGSVEQRQG